MRMLHLSSCSQDAGQHWPRGPDEQRRDSLGAWIGKDGTSGSCFATETEGACTSSAEDLRRRGPERLEGTQVQQADSAGLCSNLAVRRQLPQMGPTPSQRTLRCLHW